MAILENDAGRSIYPVRGVMSVHETTITAGISPVVYNINSDLGGLSNTRGNRGWFAVDGNAAIKIEIAQEGTSYMAQFTVNAGQVIDLTGFNINSIRLTRTTGDSAFRLVVW
jgi:hypothetical protein